MNRRSWLSPLVCAALLCASPGSEPSLRAASADPGRTSPRGTPQAASIVHRLPLLHRFNGERFLYDAYVFKGPIRFHVGTASFEVHKRRGNDPALVLHALAEGGKFGYTMRMELTSLLNPTTCRVRLYLVSQTGSERRFKRYLFQPNLILFLKKKHCMDSACRNPQHMVRVTKWFGIVPVGTKLVHCPGCKDLKHYTWQIRGRHEVSQPFLDMLSAFYAARTCPLEKGSSFLVPIVQARNRWNVQVRALEPATIKVPAGTFDCYRVVLEPRPASKGAKGKFQGLFGIKGTVKLWVDKKTRIPVRVLGTIPFAFIDIYGEVVLKTFTPSSEGGTVKP